MASKLLHFGVFFTEIELHGPTGSDSDLDTSDDEEFAGVSALAIAFNIAKGRKFWTIFVRIWTGNGWKWQKGVKEAGNAREIWERSG